MIRLRNFRQKSLNMVRTPKLKFLDTSTCELFQLGSGRDGRERELLTPYHQPLSSHPLLDRVRKSARREVSRHLRLRNVCPLYPLFGDISKCEQAGGMRVSHDHADAWCMYAVLTPPRSLLLLPLSALRRLLLSCALTETAQVLCSLCHVVTRSCTVLFLNIFLLVMLLTMSSSVVFVSRVCDLRELWTPGEEE